MAVTATPATEVLPAASAAAEAASHEPDDFEYPEGHWIAQSVWHGDAVRLATAALHNHFRDREDVLVAMELVVYYRRGDIAACLQPDVQVVFGAGRSGDRGTYKVWEEGKAPDFVLEVASPSTAGNDARYKAGEYAGIGGAGVLAAGPEGVPDGQALGGLRGERGPVQAGSSGEARGTGRVSAEPGARAGAAQREEGRGDGAGVPRPADGGGSLTAGWRRPSNGGRSRKSAQVSAESQARQEAGLRRAAEERVRALEERLRNLTARIPPSRRDSKGESPFAWQIRSPAGGRAER